MKHAAFLIIIACLILAVAPHVAGAAPNATNTTTTKLSFSEDWLNGVVIVVFNNQYGTGFWINPSYVATAAHVVSYTPNAVVEVIRGSVHAQGRVVALDRQTDVAVIYVQNADAFPDKHVFPLARELPPPTSTIYVIGYPSELLQVLGNDLTQLSQHPRVLETHLTWSASGLIELGGITDAGNSGGPVVDYSGNVIGIVSFALRGPAGTLYFATSAGNLKQLCEEHNIAYAEGTSGLLPESIANNPAAVAAITAATVNLVEDIVILGVGAAVGTAVLVHHKRRKR